MKQLGGGEKDLRREIKTGKGYLLQTIVKIQGEISQTESDLRKKKKSVRLRHLKKLVESYNDALVIVFGKKDAGKLLNYKVVGDKVETFIPHPSKIETVKKKKKERIKIRKVENKSDDYLQAETYFADSIFYDSDQVADKIAGEKDLLFGEIDVHIVQRKDVARGTGYAIVHDIVNHKLFKIPFSIDMDLTFIKLTLDLYSSNGFPVTIVVSTDDADAGLISSAESAKWN